MTDKTVIDAAEQAGTVEWCFGRQIEEGVIQRCDGDGTLRLNMRHTVWNRFSFSPHMEDLYVLISNASHAIETDCLEGPI